MRGDYSRTSGWDEATRRIERRRRDCGRHRPQPSVNRPTSRTPVCTIFGGANGSGKSSLYTALQPPGEFVNADVFARAIAPDAPEQASIRSGRHVLRRLDDLIANRCDFVYETTLSSHQSTQLMRRAAQAGYQFGLVFVVLAHPDLNILRVADRVRKGGHHIPES
ncbi:MAG: zeta toxin family protein, partial [Bosea sp. (in: a-proteobacteria)]